MAEIVKFHGGEVKKLRAALWQIATGTANGGDAQDLEIIRQIAQEALGEDWNAYEARKALDAE